MGLPATKSPEPRYTRTMRWVVLCRNKIKPSLRCIFDVEADPRYRKWNLKEKIAKANEINQRNFEKYDHLKECHIVTKAEYEMVLGQIADDPRKLEARTILYLSKWKSDRIIPHLELIEAAAERDPDKAPEILAKWHKIIIDHNLSLDKLLKRDKVVKKDNGKPLPKDITPQFRDPTK